MKTDKTIKRNEKSKAMDIPSKTKKYSNNKNDPAMPQEFEESRSMNIRMKPQPLKESKKKDNNKKEK